jgi:predicted kinase
MSELYLLCGTVGTGKSTYAKQMEVEGKAIHFSVDEWMIHFFGSDLPRVEFDKRLEQCKEMIYRICEKILSSGRDVVLDFGFWKRAERDYIRKRFNAHKINLIYFNFSDEEIKRRIEKRNNELPEYAYDITEAMFEQFSSWFEPPSEEEKPILIVQ